MARMKDVYTDLQLAAEDEAAAAVAGDAFTPSIWAIVRNGEVTVIVGAPEAFAAIHDREFEAFYAA